MKFCGGGVDFLLDVKRHFGEQKLNLKKIMCECEKLIKKGCEQKLL